MKDATRLIAAPRLDDQAPGVGGATRRTTARGVVARELKRGLDIVLALFALVLATPILLMAAVAVRITMGSPLMFVQERPGLGGRPFRLVKLRTMRGTEGRDGRTLTDDERLTPLGRLLRATSIDELPQLWNVIRGELSLVGPRPLLMRYLPRYTAEQARRHDVKPGITGWAQVHGRNAISWEEKFALDVWYVDHWSFRLDLEILAMTALKVLWRDGIAQSGHATMPEFMGTAKQERSSSDG
jgi:lipopolysaccharide/colanic/teichoic acid biosynthesis glycosyltransferase